MNQKLWEPTTEQKQNTNISRFIDQCNREFGLGISHYFELYQWSIDNTDRFWDMLWQFAQVKAEKKGHHILLDSKKMPGAQWFPDARLNYAENLLSNPNKNQLAIIFQNENGLRRTLSYQQLYHCVSQLALALRNDGVESGDRVAGILPNLPETVIAMLATTSIGAIWSSCSPDFGVDSVVDRFKQISPKVLFVCDGYYFNGKEYDRLDQIKPILNALPSVKNTVLIPYINSNLEPISDLVTSWQNYIAEYSQSLAIKFSQMAFSDPLFILYSSGTTGPPKCIVHGVGGTLLQHFKEHLLHVDVHPGQRLFYYTTCGWMMWNWMVSALASSATIVLYEGSPLFPQTDSLFDLIDNYQINIFGISAKYIDVVKKSSIVPKKKHSFNSLHTMLSTGSPLLPESYDFVYNNVKADLCLASISGGTDIISCFVLGCPILPVYRGEIQCPGLAMQIEVFDNQGKPLSREKGELVCTKPFPSMPVGFWNDTGQHKYHAAYFEKFPDVWCHGDYVCWTKHIGMIIYGRSDAVLNPSGIRIGTAEIYRQVEKLDEVQESLVIGHQTEEDNRIILFVILCHGLQLTKPLEDKIKLQIKSNTSPHHVPALIVQVTDIPRTWSGKIMELTVHNIFHGLPLKNKSALSNPEALKEYEKILRCIQSEKNKLHF